MADGKVALVTGGSRGIGRAICLALGRLKYAVAINYRANRDAAVETMRQIEQAGGTAQCFAADVGQAADRERLVEKTLDTFGAVDFLVNNAGVSTARRQDLLDDDEDAFGQVLATNLMGPHFLSQRVAKAMIAQLEAGRTHTAAIVNISSVSAYAATPHRAAYCVAKAGLSMVTALYATRLAEHGINVYEIRPGIIRTDMTAPVTDVYDQRIADGLTPIARWGTPEDVAAAVTALATDQFPFSTGEVINVDGGFHLRRL